MARRSRARMLLVLLTAVLVTPALPAAAGGGCHGELTDEAADQVTAAGNCFAPTVARVDVGARVTWTNADGAHHTVTAVGGGFTTTSEKLPGSGTTSAVFDRPGVYPYVCLLHPSMAGAVVVGDGGVAATTQTPAGSSGAAAAGLGIAGIVILLLVAVPMAVRHRRQPSATP